MWGRDLVIRALLITGLVSVITGNANATLTMSPTQTSLVPFNTTTNTIYLGATNASPNCTGAYCNSCATASTLLSSTAPYPACSLFEIHSTDNLTLNVVTNSTSITLNAPGNNFYYSTNNSTWNPVASSSVSSGNQGTVSVLMSNLCANTTSVTGNASCTFSFSQTLYIGVGPANPPTETGTIQIAYRYVSNAHPSYNAGAAVGCSGGNIANDNEGVCNLTVYPGDSKVFVNSVQVNPNDLTLVTPNLDTNFVASPSTDPSNIIYAGLAIFAVDNAQAATMSTGSDEGTMTIIPSGKATVKPTPDFIDGLTNGTTYAIGWASVDQAGILTFFAQPGLTVQPDPVYGLLNGQGCFIATAAYGSSMAPEVNTFREFRGRFLMSSRLGRWVAHEYYRFSPAIAEVIAQNEILKFISRLFLWPLLAFVHISLKFGILFATLCFASLIFGVVFFRRWWKTRRLA